ncbi:hypothetical protein DPEC_G00338200 [Dallia pectoralis]|uniref:Uncharacterized protein n=1 Tax=Dallia pectoralis TaxID=75939 RepID=A0ACC2F4P2_DALPE|nr:hypothetical protein DPEC_G00338200 [Dallia pectoralis]
MPWRSGTNNLMDSWLDVYGQGSTFGVNNVRKLSEEDVSLLAGDTDLKCFTKTQYDFTCFWETTGNTSYDFFYRNDNQEEKQCHLTVQRTSGEEEGEEANDEEKKTVLHVCFFPLSDVYLYILTYIRVVERGSNRTLYSRSVSIEDQELPDPPVNVSLHQTGQPGQMQVVWHPPIRWQDTHQCGIQYSSHCLSERTEQIVSGSSPVHDLVSLKPGEVLRVRMRVKPKDSRGHWSSWSAPVTAMVPQDAADISLLCHTCDLQNITCQWNDKAYRNDFYNVYYKLGHSEREEWRQCLPVENNSRVRFHAPESSHIRVKLSSGPATLKRTFYTEPFRINGIVQTGPPGHLRGQWDGNRLSLTWDTSLPALSVHLMHQVRYQPRGENVWKLVNLPGPETRTRLDIRPGGRFLVQVRAKPNGSVYDGYWSDWSPALQVDLPVNIGTLLVVCVPIMMFFTVLIFIVVLFKNLSSKVKRYLWPPVPSLDNVLHGFLSNINGQTWEPPYNSKQCSEETTACFVEIMSEKEDPTGGKLPRESAFLPSPERDTSGRERSLPVQVLEVNPDYVTLTTEEVLPCLQGNKYVYGGDLGAEFPRLEERGAAGHQFTPHYSAMFSSTTDILNGSYLLLAEMPTDRQEGQDSIYANLNDTRLDAV